MQITNINPFSQPDMVQGVVSVYQESFGGEPWNEGYLCPVCEKAFANKEKMEYCPACAGESKLVLLAEYWPTSKVLAEFYREMGKPGPVCVVAKEDERVIGFAWGYMISSNPNLDERLDAPGLHQWLQGDFFYLSECAIAPAHQGKGVGKLLVRRIFEGHRPERILLRTKNESRMHRLIAGMGGEVIQRISQDRIIMRK